MSPSNDYLRSSNRILKPWTKQHLSKTSSIQVSLYECYHLPWYNLRPTELLKTLGHVPTASFTSTDSGIHTRVECTPGTRTQVLEMLEEWTLDPEGTPFFWLNGMAGTGKSTIAQSICNRLDADGRLAASFFCSRSAGGGRSDPRRIIPTLAFQLAYHVQGFMKQICHMLQTPDITTQSIEKQLQQLLWEPLDNAFIAPEASWSNEVPLIVVIDGLDECSDVGAEQLVRCLLRRFEHNLPVHVRFLLFSRSERHIGIPIKASTADASRFELHDIPHSDVTRDIRRHVEAGMKEMSSRRDWGTTWYTDDDVHFIVVQADVLFIYAATVLRYLGDSKFHPKKRLQILRQLALTAKTTKMDALRPLHLLYSIILDNIGEADDLEDFEVHLICNILFMLSHFPTPLPIPAIADLLDVELEDVRACISSLSSVVRVPAESEEKTEPVITLHASFPEFVRSSSQLFPAHFRFDVRELHCSFLIRCLGNLNERLREGIPGAQANRRTSQYTVPRGAIFGSIPPHFQYAIRHWPHHALEADFRNPVLWNAVSTSMFTFVNSHLLHWIECLAGIGVSYETKAYLHRVCTHDRLLQVSDSNDSVMSKPLLIRLNFESMGPAFSHAVNDILGLMKELPCDIYHNALAWLPTWERKRRTLPTVELSLPERWGLQGYGSEQRILVDSLVAFEEKSTAAWLSFSKGDEIIAHQWNTITASESQWSLGRLSNSRVISKVASNGVFFLDPQEKTLCFKPFGSSTLSRPYSRTVTWDLPDEEALQSDHFCGLAISVNGKYAAAWSKDRFRVLLVDVSNEVCHWVPLVKSSALSVLTPILRVCFSPDETRLAVLSSERR